MTVKQLERLGGNLWEKGNYRRVYFNYKQLVGFFGLKYDGWHYTIDGEKVSNNTGVAFTNSLRHGKFWYDLTTREFASKGMHENTAQKLIERITEALEADEDTPEMAVPGKAESHTEQPPTPTPGYDMATAVGPGIQCQPRTNKRSGYCQRCGSLVRAGEGHAYYIDPDEAYEVSGWIVEHKDSQLCRAEMARRSQLLASEATAYVGD